MPDRFEWIAMDGSGERAEQVVPGTVRDDRREITICTDYEYTDTQMASKTISLKEETYDRLARAKGEGESFSDVVDRLLGTDRHPLYGLVGLLDEDAVEAVRRQSAAFREDVDERMENEEK